jgi:hypothetical protein
VTTLAAIAMAVPFEPPVDPDAPEARDWLIDELSKPVYQAAQPTLFDRIAKAISDWINSLQFGDVQGPPALGLGVIVTLVVLGLVGAFLIFGMPRLNRRSAVAGSLFGDDDDRSAARIRQDAEAAAARSDYSTALVEMFRAIARGLAERTIVTTTPGTTARDFARRAGLVFPALAERLAGSATAFDDVRYLGRDGTAEQYGAIAGLEFDLRAARPRLETISA